MVNPINSTRGQTQQRQGEWVNQLSYTRYVFTNGNPSPLQTDPLESAGFEYAVIIWSPDAGAAFDDMDTSAYMAYDVSTGTAIIKESPPSAILPTGEYAGFIGGDRLPAWLVIAMPGPGTLVVELHNPVNRRLR
jgi:hypothetical protein